MVIQFETDEREAAFELIESKNDLVRVSTKYTVIKVPSVEGTVNGSND